MHNKYQWVSNNKGNSKHLQEPIHVSICMSTLRIVHRTRTLHRFKWHITDNKPTNKKLQTGIKKNEKKKILAIAANVAILR